MDDSISSMEITFVLVVKQTDMLSIRRVMKHDMGRPYKVLYTLRNYPNCSEGGPMSGKTQ